ncbi:hypothetical protein [Gordonia sihwensis]|uniref:hypothetical protein n=1 Tax=Gordonia sihwensis TaxID=173559 RepID=UPI000AED922E|nr:hypothetical protein [Gordonia sihwensis]
MNVHVYGLHLARAGARIAARCRDHGVDPTNPILLVMACTEGPHQLAAAVANWGERPLTVDNKTGRLSGVVELAAQSLTAEALTHPDQLFAKTDDGMPAPVGEDGQRAIVWADLSSPTAVQVGDPRARAS